MIERTSFRWRFGIPYGFQKKRFLLGEIVERHDLPVPPLEPAIFIDRHHPQLVPAVVKRSLPAQPKYYYTHRKLFFTVRAMTKDASKAHSTAADRDVFHGFVFDGDRYPPERVEQAVRAMQRRLGSNELRRVNDALLARLAQAKKAHRNTPKKEMLDDPAISTLVNTLALVNTAWITTVIADNIQKRQHLRGFSVDELYSTALTGAGRVGGAISAILQYDYKTSGVDAFTHYLARAITNALLPTPKEIKSYLRVESRMRSIHQRDEDAAEPGWVDRTAPRPEAAAINRELMEIVRSVIPRLPTAQQRDTAAWMIDRILKTGELPMNHEAADLQRPRVTSERGRQIMEKTINNIRRQIEEDYPQLAAQGINGWEQFVRRFKASEIPAKRGRS